MGSYNTAVITTVGQALLTSVLGAQGTMTFTKLQTSSYSYASGTDLSALTSLNNVEQEVNVGSATIVDSTHISASATISNSGISTEYNVNTLGIFASDGVNEVLFAVSTAVTPDVIPVDSGGTPSTYKYNFTLAVSSTSDITISAVGDITANDVSFDNTTSGLPATDVQTAIDVIDAEVDDITKRLSGQSNRNFVDNAWFTINQRGQSSYSANGYTVDRFRIWGNGLTLSPTTNGITVSVSSSESDRRFVSHYIDPSYIPLLSGKTVTVSLLIADGTLISKTGVIGEGILISTSTTDEDHTVMVRCIMSGGVFFVDFGVIPGATVTIRAVKLELGSVSTLAYDVAPDYAEELLKCQRYYRQYSLIREAGIVYIDPTTNYPHVTKELQNVHMRTTPTATLLTNTGGFIDSAGHAYNPITSVSVTEVTANGFLVDMSTNQATTNTTPADVVSYIYDVVIALDANL